jgi:class 3 adenylate cyclase
MDALDVARLMHCLFSAFDAAIINAGLFKMDTIGDAYIAAGFVPWSSIQPSHHTSSNGNDLESARIHAEEEAVATSQACERVLRAAREMIAAVAECRRKTGHDVHCRIGVSTGEVLAGVLGHLQPRFHIFGSGLSAAEQHEKAGEIDTVHASPTFMAALAHTTPQGGSDVSLNASEAAAAALESGAGSSGRWNVRQSEVINLLPSSAGSAAIPCKVSTAGSSPVGRDLESRNDPSNRQILFKNIAKSFKFIISFKSEDSLSSSGDGSCDANPPLPCQRSQDGRQQHSFILIPQSDPWDSFQTWAGTGRLCFRPLLSLPVLT